MGDQTENETETSVETTEVNETVAELEKKFEDRYTEKDAAFKEVLESKEASPPVVPNFGSHSSDRHGRDDDRHHRKRSRSRSRSKSPSTLKRKGMFDCYSYFVFY